MGKKERDKGARGEREAVHVLSEFFPDAVRGVGQTQSGHNSADVEGTPYRIEVKRHKRISLFRIFEKLCEEGKSANDLRAPLILLKEDRGEWLAVVQVEELMRLLEAHDSFLGDHEVCPW